MATSGIGAIACWRDLYNLSNGAAVTNNTDLCPPYNYIINTGYFNISGSYSSDQLVKYSDISVKSTARQNLKFSVSVLGSNITVFFSKETSSGSGIIGGMITLPSAVTLRVRWDDTTTNQTTYITVPAGSTGSYRVTNQLPLGTKCTIINISPTTMVIDGTTYNLIAASTTIQPL